MSPDDLTVRCVPVEALQIRPLPERRHDSHKGSYGTVLIIAGCDSYPGAAILSALGAGRLGAGLVRLALPQGIVPEVLPAVPFATVVRCPETADGGLSAEATEQVLAAAADADAVVIGPGLGTEAATGELVASVLSSVTAPLVVDADALNLCVRAGRPLLAERTGPTVITPHPGEFARLTATAAPVGDDDRARAAAELALELGVVVVLKGHRTVVTDGERLYRETAGNPGMATGGMGDVLAGAMAAVLARGDLGEVQQPGHDNAAALLVNTASKAALAVHLHAVAGDLAADDLGQDGLLPQDVAERLGKAVRGHRLA